MNYIGSKHKLSGFIQSTVHSVCGEDLSTHIFCDLFAGTGAVGKVFKPKVKGVIANDLEYYSYILNRAQLTEEVTDHDTTLLSTLNKLDGCEGFIAQHYGAGGSGDRLYFSQENAQKIDAIRQCLEYWKVTKIITEGQFILLVASLLKSADKVANTASVYGAFLKKLKSTAQKPITLTLENTPSLCSMLEENTSNTVYHSDANQLIKKIEGDILYLDPPYNARQYGSNYHLLNTIAKYNTFTPKGKSGLPNYNKSAYCSKRTVYDSLDQLLKDAQFKYIFLSYNNEGLLSQEAVQTIMERYGTYDLETQNYQRFKADKTKNRNYKAATTTEQLHILEKK